MAKLSHHINAMLWHGMKGATIGALLVSATTACLLGLLVSRSLFGDVHPFDRQRDLEHLRNFFPFVALWGAYVGAIAGFAARAPAEKRPLVRSIGIVAGSAAAARLLTVLFVPGGKMQPRPSYIPAILAALVAGFIVFKYRIAMRDAWRPNSPENGDRFDCLE